MSKIIKKHDPLARKFLSDISIAKEFLDTHLPAIVKDKCDFSTLRIESGSYVENDLKIHSSDIVYQVDLKENAGSAYIYTLIEHQSSDEVLMPLRIIRYQLAIIQNHLDKNKKGAKLPLVVPLVFYNGKKSPYPQECDIANLFADQELYNKIGLGKFKLVDLTVMEEDQILQHGKLAVLEMLIKHIHDRDFIAAINHIIAAFQIGHDLGMSQALVDGAVSYLISGREAEEIAQLFLQIQKQLPDYEGNFMTYAESLKKEGIQLGKREGIQLGKQKGRQESQLEIAKKMLNAGFEQQKVAEFTNLSLEQIKTLH